MNELRRKMLQGSASAALLLPLIGTGLLTPRQAWASPWNNKAFTARSSSDALAALGVNTPQDSRDLIINAPEIAENGGKVEVEITSRIPDTRKLLVLADKNPMPLCAELDFSSNAQAYAKVQLKLAETMRVRAIARTGDGRNYVAFREIKVSLGGCRG